MEIYMANKTFKEPYLVKAWHLKSDGFWEKIEQCINVEVVHGRNEKNNHKKARRQFMEINKKLKNLAIINVLYI
jgi:hypothetical protein